MKNKLTLVVLIVIVVCSNCYSNSISKNLDSIQFKMDRGAIFIDVTINNKPYNFLFSTATNSSISIELINLYDLKSSNKNKEEIFYSLKEFKIGNSVFKKIDAKSFNVKSSFNLKCSKVYGIIGSDFLSSLVWKIDYKNKYIIFSNSIDDFNFSKEVKKINFKTAKSSYAPLINLNVNNINYENVMVSIGSNATINLPNKNFKDSIFRYKNVKYTGSERFSIKSYNTLFTETCVMLPEIKSQNYSLGSNMVVFSDDDKSFIGNKILKNYELTIDWKNNILYLDNYNSGEKYIIEDYGFYIYKRFNSIEVVGVYIDSDADKKGIKNGDIVSMINEIDFTKISEEELCYLLFNFKNHFNGQPINVNVIRNGKKLNFNISKEIILN
jgi:hypothetical protein